MKFGESIDIGRVEFDRFGLLGLAVGGRDVLQEGSSDDESVNVVDVRMKSNNLCSTTTATGAKAAGLEVLGCVYDGFGKRHEAVRIVSGMRNRSIVLKCQRENCSSTCTRTRVKCFQCNMPLCFSIRKHAAVKKDPNDTNVQDACFYKHVHSIRVHD